MHDIHLNVTGKLSSYFTETTKDLSYKGQLVNDVYRKKFEKCKNNVTMPRELVTIVIMETQSSICIVVLHAAVISKKKKLGVAMEKQQLLGFTSQWG
jgi:hypothetical protein